MTRGPYIFLGAFASFAAGWAGLILASQLQVGQQEPAARGPLGAAYPTERAGLAEQGRQVYRSLGCVECHTQQLRPAPQNSDLARGWGKRRTVAQDYLFDQPVLLGHLRVGPDLANVGVRDPIRFAAPWQYVTPSNHVAEVSSWHLKHLYDPRDVAPGSLMPSYAFLFEQRELKRGQRASPSALQIVTTRPAKGEVVTKEIVPRPEATALVAYLMSLNSNVSLYEAPIPAPAAKTNAAAVSTNLPAATNAAPK